MSGKSLSEVRFVLPDGGRLCCPSVEVEPRGVTYVRLLDFQGGEEVYWDCAEWQEDPQGVMAAILGAIGKHCQVEAGSLTLGSSTARGFGG